MQRLLPSAPHEGRAAARAEVDEDREAPRQCKDVEVREEAGEHMDARIRPELELCLAHANCILREEEEGEVQISTEGEELMAKLIAEADGRGHEQRGKAGTHAKQASLLEGAARAAAARAAAERAVSAAAGSEDEDDVV